MAFIFYQKAYDRWAEAIREYVTSSSNKVYKTTNTLVLLIWLFDMVNKKTIGVHFCVFKYLIFILQHFLRWIFINSLSRGFYYSIKYSSTVTIGYGAKVTRISKFEGCNRVCAQYI